MKNRNGIAPGLAEYILAAIAAVAICLWLVAVVIVPAALIKLSWLFLLA